MNWFLTWPLNQSYVLIQCVGNYGSPKIRNPMSELTMSVNMCMYINIYIYITMSTWTIDHVALPWYVCIYIYFTIITLQSTLIQMFCMSNPQIPSSWQPTRPGFSSAERIPEHVAVSALLSWAPREGEPRHIAGGLVMAGESLTIQWLAMENHHLSTGKTD